jgi:predicted RNase H-like HicB family nuclease
MFNDKYLRKRGEQENMSSTLSAVVRKEGEWYVARGLEVEIASQGKSANEALANLKEAFVLWLSHADAEEKELLEHSPAVHRITA